MSDNDHVAFKAGELRKTFATAGTPERLSASRLPCREVAITAETDNTGLISIGFSNAVRATAGSQAGIVLKAGEKTSIPVSDVSNLWGDASVNGDGVSVAYK